MAAEPSLPQGLNQQTQERESVKAPSLPSGLQDEQKEQPESPDLPPGLLEKKIPEKPQKEKPEKKWRLPPGFKGFWEVRGGLRVKNDPVQDRVSLAETRLQLGYDKSIAPYIPRGLFGITLDLIYDAIADDLEDIDLEEGGGFLDLRNLWFSFTPLDFLDIKAGRQILTWGTGNLIFLNDLFPKDYPSFFLGRDPEYLKAPSDAVKAAFYSRFANLDIVYTPRFDADRFIDGSRLSFFDPALGRFRGEDNPFRVDHTDDWFEDDEIALRLYRNILNYELALYGYHGFWKSPAGINPLSGRRIFPRLTAVGASTRGPIGPGIGNAEVSWYISEEDKNGDDPFINNSEFRFLAGYELEIAADLTIGVQYYLERMLDYGDYRDNLPRDLPAGDRNRQWITIDLTQELMAQNQLVLSLFVFYSLSGQDAYLRPKMTYDLTDNWKIQVGGNIFLGDRETFFGKFEENSNVYSAVRYSF